MATLVFWISAAIVFYAYAGYWLLLRFTARRVPVTTAEIQPTVSILIAARNAMSYLPRKLAGLRGLDYPAELVQIVMVSDGSTDGTAEWLRGQPGIVPVILEQSVGKAEALNLGLPHCRGEMLVFQDARQEVDPAMLTHLLAPFADPMVGAVSGELLLVDEAGQPSKEALGIYWKIEKSVRLLESLSGSVVGVTGALYAMRRELMTPMPPGLILDDVFQPMYVVRQGYRVLFQPLAVARDRIFDEPGKEFARKVRTLTGNLQLVRLCPWMLGPGNPILFRFLSHKMLRLLVPLLLVLMLAGSAVSHAPGMQLLFALQLIFFALALLGELLPRTRRWRVVAIPSTFLMLNLAVTIAFYKFFTRQKVWN